MMTKQNKNNLILVLFGLVTIASLYFIVVIGFWLFAENKAYPGTTVAGIAVAGESEAQIESAIAPKIAEYQKTQITFTSPKPVTVTVSELGLTPDLKKTADNVIAWGAENPFALGQKKDFSIIFTGNQDKLNAKITAVSDSLSTPAENPSYSLENGQLKITGGSIGNRVNLAATAANFWDTVGSLKNQIAVALFSITPSDPSELSESDQAEILKATQNPITLTANNTNFTVDQKTLISWIDPSGEQPVLAQRFGDDPFLAVISSGNSVESLFSTQAISNYLTDLSGQVNQPATNAQLAAQNGQVVATIPAQNGQTLNVAASISAVLTGLAGGTNNVNLIVDVEKPAVRGDNLADLGLKELVSTGYTNFSGSPSNRLVNIKVGAARFNGVLISPNEVFSFNDTLGPVDAAHGYLPELVILENKTTPEYGGGMCQVSSTAFRAALNAGMPILARTAHAYPVVYYKPYGVDATIYLPEPDLIFKNDTGHYILIQTHIDGSRLSFDFYGTKPARTVSFAGNDSAGGAVPIVEQVTPLIYDQGARGNNSFTAQFWRFIYDTTGELTTKSTWVSKYDSPDKYPH